MDVMMPDPQPHNYPSSHSRTYNKTPNSKPYPAVNNQEPRLCKFWAEGKCRYGDKCRFLHSWHTNGGGFSMLARLEGHKKTVSGIALPTAPSGKLFTGARDGTVRVWDCVTGKCDRVINFGVEVESLISEGSWVFVGLPNLVKVWNLSAPSNDEFVLNGPVGQVYALAVYKDMLFAGDAGGNILVWRGSFEANPFKLVNSLEAHSKGVLCLHVGPGDRLYSGSMDGTVKVWDLSTMQCRQILKGHGAAVMSLLTWDGYLVTASLDSTMKIWVAKDGCRDFELIHTHKEKEGILKVSGMQDAQGKPILLCSCKDGCVHLYEMESFTERGRIFSRKDVGEVQIGPYGLFFTGDATGVVTVWNWLP